MVYLLALAAAIGWGSADFVQGRASKTASAFAITFWSAVFWVPISCVVIGVMGTPFHAGDFLWGLAGGVACAVGMPLFAAALARGQMGVIAPVAATSTALIPFAFGLLTERRPTAIQLFGALIAMLAIILISATSAKTERLGSFVKHIARRDVLMGLACGACFGAYFITLHQTHKASGIWPNFGLEVAMVIAVPLFAKFMRASLRVQKAVWMPVAIGCGLDWFATLGFLYATRDGLLSMVAVVSSLYPAATVFLAWVILREHISRAHFLSLVLALIGVSFIVGG